MQKQLIALPSNLPNNLFSRLLIVGFRDNANVVF